MRTAIEWTRMIVSAKHARTGAQREITSQREAEYSMYAIVALSNILNGSLELALGSDRISDFWKPTRSSNAEPYKEAL